MKQLEVPGGVGCDTRTQPPQPWQLTVGPEGGGGGVVNNDRAAVTAERDTACC